MPSRTGDYLLRSALRTGGPNHLPCGGSSHDRGHRATERLFPGRGTCFGEAFGRVRGARAAAKRAVSVRGPAWTPEQTEETARIQKEHIAHLTRMGEAGHIVIAGPFGDQEDATKRGMCLYRVGSIDEARRLASEDPAVKSGRLKVEVMTWWVEKGYMTFPKAPPIPAAAPAEPAK